MKAANEVGLQSTWNYYRDAAGLPVFDLIWSKKWALKCKVRKVSYWETKQGHTVLKRVLPIKENTLVSAVPAVDDIPERCPRAAHDPSWRADFWLKWELFFDVFQDWWSDVRETLKQHRHQRLNTGGRSECGEKWLITGVRSRSYYSDLLNDVFECKPVGSFSNNRQRKWTCYQKILLRKNNINHLQVKAYLSLVNYISTLWINRWLVKHNKTQGTRGVQECTRKAWLALSLRVESSGLSTGVWLVNFESNWLTSSADCCKDRREDKRRWADVSTHNMYKAWNQRRPGFTHSDVFVWFNGRQTTGIKPIF